MKRESPNQHGVQQIARSMLHQPSGRNFARRIVVRRIDIVISFSAAALFSFRWWSKNGARQTMIIQSQPAIANKSQKDMPSAEIADAENCADYQSHQPRIKTLQSGNAEQVNAIARSRKTCRVTPGRRAGGVISGDANPRQTHTTQVH